MNGNRRNRSQRRGVLAAGGLWVALVTSAAATPPITPAENRDRNEGLEARHGDPGDLERARTTRGAANGDPESPSIEGGPPRSSRISPTSSGPVTFESDPSALRFDVYHVSKRLIASLRGESGASGGTLLFARIAQEAPNQGQRPSLAVGCRRALRGTARASH